MNYTTQPLQPKPVQNQFNNIANTAQAAANFANAANNLRSTITPQQMNTMSNVFNGVTSGLQNPLMPQ
jgi:hypothetical protein